MGNVLNGIGVGVGSAVLKPLDIALGTSCESTLPWYHSPGLCGSYPVPAQLGAVGSELLTCRWLGSWSNRPRPSMAQTYLSRNMGHYLLHQAFLHLQSCEDGIGDSSHLLPLGVFGFLARSLGKMARAFCGTYFFAIRDICGFLWYKLKNTKRINRRRRFQDHDECSECESSSDTWLDAGKRAKKKRRSFGPERHPKRARHQAKRGNRKHRTRDVKS
ncbi:hypothetical protein AMTR_s00029p00036300 [Amborella trichopoda]|uniref:Uncharacterized protein n=1 Tax=Amborella trichopoda TaxID=13333 RepID=W1PNK8_AMBTC|nr:hypothetical protein AMTR_s00029p00036300 [Amborella trichopoda]